MAFSQCERPFLSVFLSIPLSFFFSHKSGFFFKVPGPGRDNWFHCSSVPDGHKYTSLQSSLNELLETMGEGRRTAKTQAVCLELSPLYSILGFPLPTQPPPPRPSHQGCLYGRGSGVLDIFYLQYTLPKHILSLYFAQTLLRNAKLVRGYQNHRNFALNTSGALKLRRFSSPDLQSGTKVVDTLV